MEAVSSEIDCLYCGAGNPKDRKDCYLCHNTLITAEEIAQAIDELIPVIHPPDMSGLQFIYEEENGLSHPDWRSMSKRVRATKTKEDWWEIFHELAKQWLLQLKADLGGHYHCYESENFLALCAEGTVATKTMLEYAENLRADLHRYCGQLWPREWYGKHVLLIFTDQDDYYAYVSHFHQDGDHSHSQGMFLSRGYLHIAFPFTWINSSYHVIAHELVHNCTAHLRLPIWLGEGLAQKLERLAANRSFNLDRDLVIKHREYWNDQNIQEFWSGTLFYVGDERNKLSYSLASILTEVLSENWPNFLDFVSQADIRDAGQDASLRILGRCLGETTVGFLGPGNWRPQRKAISEHWKAG